MSKLEPTRTYSDHTATDGLRRMLDERGVEWWEDAFSGEHRTVFDGKDGVRYCVYQLGSSLFISSILPVTPEQAVEATLGRGTCRMNESGLPVFDGHDDGYFSICSECGFVNYMRRAWLPIKFCPNCGRRIEQ